MATRAAMWFPASVAPDRVPSGRAFDRRVEPRLLSSGAVRTALERTPKSFDPKLLSHSEASFRQRGDNIPYPLAIFRGFGAGEFLTMDK